MIEVRRYEDTGVERSAAAMGKPVVAERRRDRVRRAPFGHLIAWNDDEVAPFSGLGMHDHENVEIVTLVREGAITQRDSLGNIDTIPAGHVHVMSAGAGVQHSEYNADPETAKFFQIRLRPRSTNDTPRWRRRRFPREDRSEKFVAVASGFGCDPRALRIDSDARVVCMSLTAGMRVEHRMCAGSDAYLVTTDARIDINGQELTVRDGAIITNESLLTITATDDTDLIMVEVRDDGC